MRHDDDRARVLLERVLEHLLAAEIEVMRREAGRTGEFTVTVMGGPATPADVDAYREAGVDRLVVAPWRRSADAAN